ncbi:MAG TPA: hypothetical protein VGV61_16855, partial [Thermoanaerobaculia bacterium]|nr:hypothetical protein [Thermoanaerobaculia bacterium]
MTTAKPFFSRLQHRDRAVRAAARRELLEVVGRHAGDLRAAAAELGVSWRTVRKAFAAEEKEMPVRGGDPRATAASALAPPPVAASALAAPVSARVVSPSPFVDFEERHRAPLGAQGAPHHEAVTPPAWPPEPAARQTSGTARDAATPSPPAVQPVFPPSPVAPLGAAPRTPEPLHALQTGEWPHHQPDAAPAHGQPARAMGAAPTQPRRLAFVLHAHLPWVLGHGTWPHGEDWLAEAVTHCYLPLVSALQRLTARGGRHLLTVSLSPVLAAQLGDARTRPLVDGYLAHRRDAARALGTGHPLARWWEATYDDLAAAWRALDGDLLGALARLADADAIELSTCAATHGYLPLLHRREHVALQVIAAVHNHERWFGAAPRGLWMPECAYRGGGPWRHPITGAAEPWRAGNETFLAAAGIDWTVVDAHLLLGGEPLVPYPDVWAAGEGSDGEPPLPVAVRLQPRLIDDGPVAVLPREPHAAHQVWSRQGGYPGDPRYLDFHKRHAETGLRLWRVTDAAGDLGDKLPYHPADALAAAAEHGRHFHQLLAGIEGLGGGVAVCPYDAELFGHWWFEGVAWLEAVLAGCLDGGAVSATTPSRELEQRPPRRRVRLHEGSWGEAGDDRMWVNEQTAWMWDDLRLA